MLINNLSNIRTGVHMRRKIELTDEIIKEVKKHKNGIWIRKLARNLKEPVSTIHKYVTLKDYAGKYLKVKKMPQELGGHLIIKLKRGRK